MLDRTVAPAVQPLASISLPAADVLLLPNGARLHVLRNNAQPVIRLQIAFQAGKWYESTPGVSLLTARMLLEGTRTRTARQIADEVAFYGASLECEQGFDRATLTLYCLSRYLDKLLPLIVEVITEPTFPNQEFSLLKTRTIQSVRVERQKTSYLAAELFSQTLYGDNFPYGIVFNEDTFQQIAVTEVQDFHQNAYRLEVAEIFLCGAITEEQQQQVAQLLGQTTNKNTLSVPTYTIPSNTASQGYITVSDSIQSSLRIGRLWPAPTHPDYHALQVLVKVLGGYFGSRLMKNIREDKGLTYGIYSAIQPREHATGFVIGTDVNAASAPVAIQEIHYELHQLQQHEVPTDELQTVKNYMTGKFANELSTVFEQCDKYKFLVFLNLPRTFYTTFLQVVSNVNSSHLLSLAQQYLSPDNMIEIVAGPAK